MEKSWKKIIIVTEKFIQIRKNGNSKECVCAICLENLCVNDCIFLLINNYEFFPNTFVHEKCWSEETDMILHDDWQMAQRYKHWFI